MRNADSREVATILRQYKGTGGVIVFEKVFDIPKSARMPALAEKDFTGTVTLVTAAVTMALENINLKRPLNAIQILDLSEAIIDSSGEDNLSFEDLMLFLQGLVRGKYPISYESLDIPRFMKAFDIYREERWQEGVKLRDDRITQWQGLGDAARSAKHDPLSEHLSNMSGRMADMKKELSEHKHENNILKQADKFYGNDKKV